jgi:hypothetical protein
MLSKDFYEFVALLKKHDAEYLIMGAMPLACMGTRAIPATWTFG